MREVLQIQDLAYGLESDLNSVASLQHEDAAVRKNTHWAVRRLTLNDFRNYPTLRLELNSGPVVLTGANGTGKTNLLEAVSYLAPGRGLRGARLSEVTRRDATPGAAWAVAATLATPVGEVNLGTGLESGQDSDKDSGETQKNAGNARIGGTRRVVHINGQPARPGALVEWTGAVWLTPAMDRLFAEGAGNRRRFLDRIVTGFDPGHATRTASYERVLRERIRLLREKGGYVDPDWLCVLEETLAQTGTAIACARQEIAVLLSHACEQNHGPFPVARVEVIGDVESWLEEGSALEAEERFHTALTQSRVHDAESGRTIHGPQRSDLVVQMRSTGVGARECSTGEQKGLLISLILAVAELIREMRGSPPLLLLDEVAAHLDSEWRVALFERLSALNAQAWLTGTDATQFEGLSSCAHFYHVADNATVPY